MQFGHAGIHGTYLSSAKKETETYDGPGVKLDSKSVPKTDRDTDRIIRLKILSSNAMARESKND